MLPGIEVFSADGSASTVTNERGQYVLSMRLPPGGALLTTRRIGWAPSYRTVMRQDGATVEWSPVLASTTVLAERVVRATGVPEMLKSWRYNDFFTHRARGVGQFFMMEEIWNSISLGDVLNHGRGIRVSFSYGNKISRIVVPSCIGGDLGVFVNGNDETAINELKVVTPAGVEVPGENTAAAVLERFVTSAIVAMELYTGHLQIPPEYANPKYCAVIALWTR
jgi:hypothetical protein